MLAIIGGSGFIGTRLVPLLLAAGHQVRIIDKVISAVYPQLTVVADVRDPTAMINALEGCDVIWNLAAEHQDNVLPVSLYYEVNVQGARHICHAASRWGINRIIFTSSVAVYGFTAQDTDETGVQNPFHDYGKSKREAEAVFEQWRAADAGRSLLVVRPTVVFGEGNRGNVYNLLRQIASGRFVMIGNGVNLKSMAYVGNVAAFLHFCLSLPGSHVFNYADKPDMTMNRLVGEVSQAVGRSGAIRFRLPYRPALWAASVLDILARAMHRQWPISAIRIQKFCASTQFSSRYVRDTGFEPPYLLEEGLRLTLQQEFGRMGSARSSPSSPPP